MEEIGAEHVFDRKPVFITLTSGAEGTAFYIDGVLLRTVAHVSLSVEDLSGDIVIGTSPVNRSTWAGWIRGLAIYHQELSSKDVFMHYTIWTEHGPLETLEREAVALYRFNERAGSVAHNRGTNGPDLEIPASFKVPYGRALEMGWERFEYTNSYLRDTAVNIIGFVPLGFFFCAYWSSTRRNLSATLATIVLGGLISLTIEILQKYIPVRDSDLTDVITNTLGTAIGAILFQLKMTHSLLTHFEAAIRRPKRFWKSGIL